MTAGSAPWSRRRVLAGGGALAAATLLGSSAAGAQAGDARSAVDLLRPPIRPRAEWADSAPRGPLDVEAAGDVRFLLVHHTASANDYRQDEVPRWLRQFYAWHTAPEKGWPDVAYNFFVDRYGTIWEGRAGSLERPVKGDATGGSQGFAMLCSLVGNLHEAPPSAPMIESLNRLLAWLAARYDVDTTPGATTTFTSRGSNRWPAGSTVTARTISAHRDMSTTLCPGDHVVELLDTEIPSQVTALRQVAAASVAATSTAPPTAPPATVSTTALSTTTVATTPSTTTTTVPSTAGSGAGESPLAAAMPADGDRPVAVATSRPNDDSVPWPVFGLGAAGAAAAAAALVRLRNRRS